MENADKPKVLYKITNKLLNRKTETPLPSYGSLPVLIENFSDFFTDKISKIRSKLTEERHMGSPDVTENIADLDFPIMYEFTQTTEEEVRKIILSSPSKHCNLDPIPT